MKNVIYICFLFITLSLSITPNSWSYPINYTLEGHVIEGPGIFDATGYIAKLGIEIGSTVTYNILIDLDAKGNVQLSDGSSYELEDPSGKATFFAHYLNGSTITSENYASSYNGISANNYGGNNWRTSTFSERWLNISLGNNFISIFDMNEQPNSFGEWALGSPSAFGAASLCNTIYDEFGNSSSFFFEAQITRSTPYPVPEPSSLVLIGSSLITFFLLRKRFCK